MVGRAKSIAQKTTETIAITERYMETAMEIYRMEQMKIGAKMGLVAVCRYTEKLCQEENGVEIRLSKSSLERRLKGVKSQARSNAEKGWLTEEESDTVIQFAIDMANEGWPLSKGRLVAHVNLICQARHGLDFEGVGKNWVTRWIKKHSARLHSYWSRPLEASRARAVNASTKEEYFRLLGELLEGPGGDELITPDLIFGADETGIQEGLGTREFVYGPAGKSVQHQQRSGKRDNTTSIETICADGSVLRPTIIFKGQNYQTSWVQNNPLRA